MRKKTKFFRIARAGTCVDDREITAQQLEEMADTYNPTDYTAVINLEHYRGVSPDSAFGNYGTVNALKTEKDGNNIYLTAELAPNDNLIALNKKGQKLFTSIEISQNFAKTGKAYLSGLAVTDSPASMGTEMLSFSVKGQGEITFPDFENYDDFNFSAEEKEEDKPSLIDAVKNIFTKQKQESAENIEDVSKAVIFLTEEMQKLSNKIDAAGASADDLKELSKEVAALKEKTSKLSFTPAKDQEDRPAADGGTEFLTTC